MHGGKYMCIGLFADEGRGSMAEGGHIFVVVCIGLYNYFTCHIHVCSKEVHNCNTCISHRCTTPQVYTFILF